MATNVHIINHTHWDREWFLTSVYTSRWIPGLIDKLEGLAAANPDFHFLFDGQTLVIEDLLAVAPEYRDRVNALIENGRLQIGPYYCQPDWQLTSGELLIRNLMYGHQDVVKHGGQVGVGWLVDTFGHISQSPQIHRLFGLDSAFVWRGVPELAPYFNWQSPDGSNLLAINLFGGYRNLYGITHAPEVAQKRLCAEVEKLRPFYPTADLPLFDGYDLEDSPEDPLAFYASQPEIDPELALQETTPSHFAQAIKQKQLALQTIHGELNSGKYGATFPGTFSARTYLKVMARDCQQLLCQRGEPLAAMAWLKGRKYNAAQYETWGRMLLQNAVHDCLCGVSIDQVHEKMEYSYRQVFDGLTVDIEQSLGTVLSDFAPGKYAISTVPFAVEGGHVVDGEWLQTKTDGVGVWPVVEAFPIETVNETVETFSWKNAFYTAEVTADGGVSVGNGRFGNLLVFAEHGDTYSDELGEQIGTLEATTPLTIVEKSAQHSVVSYEGQWQGDNAEVSVTVRLQFDQSPLLRWQVDLDSHGTNISVEMGFTTGQPGQIHAGMPFDVVARETSDANLLPRELAPDLASVLLGQRELGEVTTFPFHDFVTVTDTKKTTAVLAKGIHSYRATPSGDIMLTLRRSVEWLTAANLENRIGDAGPFFYVPDARCERQVTHEIAVAVGDYAPDSLALQQLNAAYQNPPLIVSKTGEGTETEWSLLQENLPLSSLAVQDGNLLARFYNPTTQPQDLAQVRNLVNVWGESEESVSEFPPKKIATIKLDGSWGETAVPAEITLLNPALWRVGKNAGLPDEAILAQLQQTELELSAKLSQAETNMQASTGSDKLRWQHQMYVFGRERAEAKLSLLLNQRKLAVNGELQYDYLYEPDQEIAAVGLSLNRLRIKRRIFDYVVESIK